MEGKAEENNISAGQHLLKKFPKTGGKKIVLILGSLGVVLAGIGTGWLISGRSVGGGNGAAGDSAPQAVQIQGGEGINDEETFRDTAEGILEEGGIDGEGTHHLVREGGPSKYAYLTSTVIDLQPFVGKTVKVWGETISARNAGWLMDVGKIKVLE
ncbi:MAG: hypothetical protein ACC618_02325 [Patescibacteria group bacterium]